MKIAVIAPTRHPIAQPYAGGLEAFCGLLVHGLRSRGHQVDLYAAEGSVGHVKDFEFPASQPHPYATDITPRTGDDQAFQQLCAHLRTQHYDVIHNNSLHPALLLAHDLPVVTTLHCPALPEMNAALPFTQNLLTAVSASVTGTWNVPRPVHIIPNCVDSRIWTQGPGGGDALWFGRITPEKGVHLAMDAARLAGIPLTIVGRIADRKYYEHMVEPRLGPDVTLLPALAHQDLARLVGRASVVAVTPQWDEPFGLVAIEAMSAGTPVVAFARGGLKEVLHNAPGILIEPDNVTALAAGLRAAVSVDRDAVAHYARAHFSLTAFLDAYLAVYLSAMYKEAL